MDQAGRLKKEIREIISVASGKGGVGKTTISVNLGIAISMFKKVLLIDGDLSLGNADIILGITPPKHIGHFLNGGASVKEIVYKVDNNFLFVPSGSGIEKLSRVTETQFRKIEDLIFSIQSDVTIVDTQAGIGSNVIKFSLISNFLIVVIVPDTPSLSDSYALIKVLKRSGFSGKIFVVVNMAVNQKEAEIAFGVLGKVARNFLGLELEYLGYVPFDDEVRTSFKLQKPVITAFPKAESSQKIKEISEKLMKLL